MDSNHRPSGREATHRLPRTEVALKLDVALIPAQAGEWRERVCIVVDVLRASSTIVTLLERSVTQVIPARSLTQARRIARGRDYVLVGERDGIAPPDFDYGNSPSRLAHADLAGKTVVLATTNGSVVLNRLENAPRVFVGCFLNARACCRAAVEEAARGELGVGIVCAGRYDEFALDDAVCAGYLVRETRGLIKAFDIQPVLNDAALAVSQLYGSYASIEAAFLQSRSGKRVVDIGDAEDNHFCGEIDVSQKVPVLVPGSPCYVDAWKSAS
jgi:2-phosphosulfolactate phosphatase